MFVLLCGAFIALAVPLQPARVVVAGGTHGNEYTGVYVLQRLGVHAAQFAAEHPSLRVEPLLVNPRAHEANVRFIDDDLNRQFSDERLNDATSSAYEAERAREIVALCGPKGANASAAVCIDMHTTTSNMGCTLICQEYSPLSIRAAAYVYEHYDAECEADAAAAREALMRGGEGNAAALAARLPEPHPLRILLELGQQSEKAHLASVARDGIEIEVGPTPQGMLRADCVASTERALRLILRYLELHFAGRAPPPRSPTLPVYVDRGKVPFVESHSSVRPASKMPGALVAPSLQDRDFAPLRKGEPLYMTLDGTLVAYDGSLGDVVHPVFVNEAAYYLHESGRGVGMSERRDWPVP